MSRSPTEAEGSGRADESSYADGWAALDESIRSGNSFSGRERNGFFLNLGGGRFANTAAAVGFDQPDDARALAFVDWDHDGDLDLWMANRTGPRLRFMRNTCNQTSGERNFIAFRLRGTRSNRDGIGARVVAHVGGQKIVREVRGVAGAVQAEPVAYFGLGDASKVDRLEVVWPGGETQVLTDVTAGRAVVIRD